MPFALCDVIFMAKRRWTGQLYLVFLASQSVVPSAHAVVVDRFQCEIKYTSQLDGHVVETVAELAAARRPLGPANGERVALSEGVADLATTVQGERFQAALRLVYTHAVKVGQNGQPLRAAQHVCLSNSFLAAGAGVSTDCRPACENAFDPKCKWTRVELRGGIPLFDARGLAPVTQTLAHGSVQLACHFAGTLD